MTDKSVVKRAQGGGAILKDDTNMFESGLKTQTNLFLVTSRIIYSSTIKKCWEKKIRWLHS